MLTAVKVSYVSGNREMCFIRRQSAMFGNFVRCFRRATLEGVSLARGASSFEAFVARQEA